MAIYKNDNGEIYKTHNEAYFEAMKWGLVAVLMTNGKWKLTEKWKAEKAGDGPWILDRPQVEEIFDEVGESLGYKLLP